MSYFSVSDFLAAWKLIADIIGSLKGADGAKADYQDLLHELECLGQILRRLDSIKYATLSYRRPLEDFLVKMKGYDDSLGIYSKTGAAVKGKVDRARWPLGKKEEGRGGKASELPDRACWN